MGWSDEQAAAGGRARVDVTRRRGLMVAALGLAGALVLASCGANKYTYVDNGQENTYIRVPSAWKVFNVNGDGVRPAALPDSVEAGTSADGVRISNSGISSLARRAMAPWSMTPRREYGGW